MLKDRLRTSAILIAIVSSLVYLDGNYSLAGAEGLWLLPLLLFFAVGTSHDAVTMLRKSGRSVDRFATLVGTTLITATGYIPHLWPLTGDAYPTDCPVGRLGWIVIGSLLATFLIIATEMRRYGIESNATTDQDDGVIHDAGDFHPSRRQGALECICNGSFIAIYIGVPLAMLVALRSLGSGNWGLAALLTTIAVTKSTDAGAYFTGKAIGKHKLIPRLSPGKTWEGSVGGTITAIAVAYSCLTWLFPAVAGEASPPLETPSIAALSSPWVGAVVLGSLLAVTGMLGDLAESLVKRVCDAKDSGNLLPGLGGVWDVTDSLIMAALPAFLCFSAGIAG
ncbi:MAG: phosphatidate cytidylyltransferase [Planctomycetota bacterium]|nr:phosphatidate cytidylyltransferase [Planctomycetota bacterium]